MGAKASKLRINGLCARSSAGTGEFPAQMAINAENVAIWWRYHASIMHCYHGLWEVSIQLGPT